jgi:hypothetical protein
MRAAVRRLGGRLVRRFGLLPGDTPDGLGDDESLGAARLDAEVVVYFPDTVDALYQLEQWYPALRALDKARPTAIIVRDSKVAQRVRAESRLAVIAVGRLATLEGLLRRSDVRVALYVNHSQRNFELLRFASLVHVSLLHGDSDKTVTVSNQIKAYDFSFVAGRAAVDRAARNIMLFDVGRLLPVGRPSMDADREAEAPAEQRVSRRSTVLYAPTWEGAQPTASYTSVAGFGERIVRTLLTAGFAVRYRPHPLTGVRLAEVGEADRRIREAITAAAQADPAAGHRVDTEVPVTASFDGSDLLLCDVSAMSVEWLPTGRPLIITVPAGPAAVVAGTALEQAVPRLDVAGLDSLADTVRREIEQDPGRARRLDLVEYYLGDTTPGASIRAFITAVDEVADRHAVEWSRARANGAVGP